MQNVNPTISEMKQIELFIYFILFKLPFIFFQATWFYGYGFSFNFKLRVTCGIKNFIQNPQSNFMFFLILISV